MSDRRRDLSLSRYFRRGLNMAQTVLSGKSITVVKLYGSHLFSKSHVHLRKYYGIRHATRSWDYSQQVGVKPT